MGKTSDLVDSHRPKNGKYKYYFKDDKFLSELIEEGFDISTLDTIGNDGLTNAAYDQTYEEHERTIIGKAKEPTILDDGIIISKKMVTKADKKLQSIDTCQFKYDEYCYYAIKLVYEKFDILELFVLC